MATIRPKRSVRYGVVGLGYFAQAAILPAFSRAKYSELTAIFSDDETKLSELGDRYKLEHRLGYEDYDDFLSTGKLDAVYIALPNNQHCDYTLRAAERGVHVLCEKPMAVTEDECRKMIEATQRNNVKLMIAYRLHFERANLEAIEIATSGKLGDVRIFNSLFTQQVAEGNTRLRAELGGGPLHDIGIYCINAARYLFRDEPTEVVAMVGARGEDGRFEEVPEHVAAVLRFPADRMATFVASFGATPVSEYDIIGTKGMLRVNPAYEHSEDLKHELIDNGKPTRRTFRKRDQVAPELIHFSSCILDDQQPEPSGAEGLADVRIMQAIARSATDGRAVKIEPVPQRDRPDLDRELYIKPHDMPELVHASPPSGN
jgi:predicted dehydrogenase